MVSNTIAERHVGSNPTGGTADSRMLVHRRSHARRMAHKINGSAVRQTAPVTGHMTPEEFRKYGHAAVDWIADYYERIESFPVLSQVAPGEIRAGAARRTRRRRASRSTRCSPTSIASSCRASRTGSTRRSSPTSRPTRAGRRSSATCSRPGSACRACSGRPRPRPPSWRRTSWTGWPSCSTCPSGPSDGTAASSSTPPRTRPWWRCVAALHRASGGRDRARRRPERELRRLHLEPDALLGREGVPDRRARRRRVAQARRRPGDARGAARAPARADRRRPGRRRRPGAGRRRRSGRPATGAVDPVAELGRDRARRRRLAARRRRLGRRRRGRAGVRAGSTTGSSRSTPTPPTRTSGC